MSMLSTIRTAAAAAFTAVAVLGATGASADTSDERWFNLVNESEWAIDAVFVAHNDNPEWGPNLLRGDALVPADYVELDPVRTEGHCEFDVLLVFEDGAEMKLDDVDLCQYVDIYTDGYDYQLSI